MNAILDGFDEGGPEGGGADGASLAAQPANDSGNAERLIRRAGADLRHVDGVGWAAWAGDHWSTLRGPGLARAAAIAAAGEISAEAELIRALEPTQGDVERASWVKTEPGKLPTFQREQRARARDKWALDSGNRARVDAGLDLASARLMAHPDDFDAAAHLVGVPGGVLDLEVAADGGDPFRPAAREDMISRRLGVAWDAEASCPKWRGFIALITSQMIEGRPHGDPAMAACVQRWAGSMLWGENPDQVIALLLGKGANGKSSLMAVLARVLGDYRAHAAVQSFLEAKRDGAAPSPDMARLPGVRMVTTSEVKERDSLDEARIKDITGGEPITARKLNQDLFEFSPRFKLVVPCNHVPRISGADHGIWRRMLIVPFDLRFWSPLEVEGEVAAGRPAPPPELHARDRADLERELMAELPGILAWMVDGLRMWREDGLDPPARARAAKEQVHDDADDVRSFLNWACRSGREGDRIESGDLYAAYAVWTDAGKPCSRKSFSKRAEAWGAPKHKASVIVHLRVRWVTEDDEDDETRGTAQEVRRLRERAARGE